jgi:hypothetical protein
MFGSEVGSILTTLSFPQSGTRHSQRAESPPGSTEHALAAGVLAGSMRRANTWSRAA